MSEFNNLIKQIKKAAVEAVEASKPAAFYIATVVNTQPLQVKISSKLVLTKAQLILTKSVESMVVGDRVVLARVPGGRQFIAMDKVVDELASGN
ncbi:Protein of unknown function [Acetitomaculum ruminis DSM 5522]|uniref:Phage protein n=1 Tax=Acetitomaculum ruminis DSM 5522 TaxID=1120918 RepID=A0A1I0WFR9_9FIRM|nr:DUF2577 family protein [Acetitomaculum ruminis]SFA87404.1 Protein of unknown function [Acetitomaculum ruminis DSM 5522]